MGRRWMSGGWKYAAASVIGTSHLKSPDGICQDSHCCAYSDAKDCFIGVVSDGAGSASQSKRGSQISCDLVVERACSVDSEMLHSKAFALATIDEIRDRLSSAANEAGLRIRDFACTLLVAIVGSDRATFWQIGDGAICFRKPTEEIFRFVFWPVKGDYANITEFITDPDYVSEIEFDSWPGSISDLALFTDGLERLALDFKAGEAHSKFFSGFFSYLHREPSGRLPEIENKLIEFLSSDRVNGKTDDDKTLILATVESK